MRKNKLLLMLSLFVILMTVFGNVFAQDTSLPAFKVSSVVTDEKVVLTTKNFPAETTYTVSMTTEADAESYTPVARFNSRSGGNLNVTVTIPEKFKGAGTILLSLQDENGGMILGNFVNIPEEEPADESPVITLVNQEPAAEEKTEEPVTEEKTEEPLTEEKKEEPVTEEKTEEPAAEEKTEEPVAEEKTEKPAAEEKSEEPAAEEKTEEPIVDEKAEEAVSEEKTEAPAAAETQAPVCNYDLVPTVVINAVVRNESVTFTTANFPADSNFTVSMGYYVATWTPSREPMPYRPAPRPQEPAGTQIIQAEPSDVTFYVIGDVLPEKPAPHFDPIDKKPIGPEPRPQNGAVTRSFSGTAVGTFDTGDGAPQTLTFAIPAELKGVSPIALWISDNGSCGFYSYNYFYNTSTN